MTCTKRFERTPDGYINNCALANGEPEEECQICEGKCPDKGRFDGTDCEVQVRIDYFKPTGKWYSSAEVMMHVEHTGGVLHAWKVSERIQQMRDCGQRPGLGDSLECEFVWVVRVLHAEEVVAQFLWLPNYLDDLARQKWRYA